MMLKRTQKTIVASILAATLSVSSIGVHAQATNGISGHFQKLNMTNAIDKSEWKAEYEKQGCSQAAWEQLKQGQKQILNDYQRKVGKVNKQIFELGSIMPSTLQLNGCLSSVEDMFGKYTQAAEEITDKIRSADSLGGALSGLFGKLVHSFKKKAEERVCQYVDNKISSAMNKLVDSSGLGNVLNSSGSILDNPFGAIEQAANKKMDEALNKALDNEN